MAFSEKALGKLNSLYGKKIRIFYLLLYPGSALDRYRISDMKYKTMKLLEGNNIFYLREANIP